MGTVSVRLPDEEVEKLERLARRRGTTKSALMREFAETALRRESVSGLRDLVGVLSGDEARGLEEEVERIREEMDEEMRRRAREAYDET